MKYCFQFAFLLWSNLQDPAEADKLLKIQRELDETKIILVSIKLIMHYFLNHKTESMHLLPSKFAIFFL